MPIPEQPNGRYMEFSNRREVVSNTQEKEAALGQEVVNVLLKPALECADASQRIRAGLRNESPDIQDEMEAILSGLCDPRPAMGEEPTPELNRYLSYDVVTKKDGSEVSVYRIRPGVVQQDLDNLTTLQRNHPELAADIEAVKTSLRDYARRDERMVSHELGVKVANGSTNRALGEMGKTAAFLALSFAAVVTAGISIATMIRNKSLKGFSFAPFLYGGVALLIAKKDVRDSIFGSKLGNALAPVDKVLNQSSFKDMARTYGMEGSDWSRVVESCMEEDAERDELLKNMEDGSADPKDVDAHIKGMSADPRIQASLKKMAENGDYARMIRILSDVEAPEARDVILDYTKSGAWKHAKVR